MNISSTSTENSNSDQEVLVKVDNVGKIFCRDLKKSLRYGVKDSLRDLIGRGKSDPSSGERQLREGEFWANKGVSFELRRGECLGLIGHNGAGKTTLLKMLNGLIKPDTGKIEMRGRVGALIALGAGFNPILTGRENIYINGSVLGFSKKEINDRINNIIDFAQIDKFIDAPVQTYSSGMQVRLGFAIASSLEPDILILDEVLAVGDVGFTIKCLNRIRELSKDSTIIFVSHNMQYISNFCTRVMVLDRGESILDANNPGDGINCYFRQMEFKGGKSGRGGAKLEKLDISVSGAVCDIDPVIRQGDEIEIDLSFSIGSEIKSAVAMVCIDDASQSQVIAYPLLSESNESAQYHPGTHRVRVPIGAIDLNAGSYSFLVTISDTESKINLLRESGVMPFSVRADNMMWSKIVRPTKVNVCSK